MNVGKILALEEIEQRYDSEWVLLESPEVDANLGVLSGRIAWHCKDRDEVDRKAVEMRLKSSAFLFTGTMLEDIAFIIIN